MQGLLDLKTLTEDRKEILKILKSFKIDILKLEKKNNDYIIWLGGINKLLYQKNKIELETILEKSFSDSDKAFKNRNIKFIFH